MEQMFFALDKVRLNFQMDKKICPKLKLIVILIDLLVTNMVDLDSYVTT